MLSIEQKSTLGLDFHSGQNQINQGCTYKAEIQTSKI